MSNDPMDRIPVAFGDLLIRLRAQRNLSQEAFAISAGLSDVAVVNSMEAGQREPTLTEFFRIANALRSLPEILLVDVVAQWRYDPADIGLYKSRVSDLSKLFRLGYFSHPGNFHELPRTYTHIDEAIAAATTLNATRRSRRLPLLDTVLIYVRLGNASVQSDKEGLA
jgi:transcriptional regulator with XRE-family HTH domain